MDLRILIQPITNKGGYPIHLKKSSLLITSIGMEPPPHSGSKTTSEDWMLHICNMLYAIVGLNEVGPNSTSDRLCNENLVSFRQISTESK